jgi:spoIIIJ-associated protein
MKHEFIATGKTINDAVDNACEQCGVDRDNVEIEILETPSRGFLGIGANDAKVKIFYEVAEGNNVKNFVEELFKKMGVIVSATISTTEQNMNIDVEGENLGAFIGRRGETLDALQYLVSLYANRNIEEHLRVSLDIENYRKKRQDTLERLAKRLASNAVKKKGTVTLEPMQAYERRIIHATLQGFRDVSTYSTGLEPRRKVVITYTPNKE